MGKVRGLWYNTTLTEAGKKRWSTPSDMVCVRHENDRLTVFNRHHTIIVSITHEMGAKLLNPLVLETNAWRQKDLNRKFTEYTGL